MSATTETHVSPANGGKVHLPYPIDTPFPLCLSGAQMRRGTRYAETSREVTCEKCAGILENRARFAEKVREQLYTALDTHIADYDVKAIAEEIRTTYGMVDIETINVSELGELLRRHDTTAR